MKKRREPIIIRNKARAPRNRTVGLTLEEKSSLRARLKTLLTNASLADVIDSTICQETFVALDFLPTRSVDLVFADPPYNLTKSFNETAFSELSQEDYEGWLESWIVKLPRILKPTGSVYVCGDWRSSTAIHRVLLRHFIVRNRISWEREKGRGAEKNWKNACEDIWFCTVSREYVFSVDRVKLKRRVMAPYTDSDGNPKDWSNDSNGRYRTTYPSNIWTDLTVPFWSMWENTDHPTQKPEKLLAKIILASSNEGATVLDPFVGSGTTSVVAKKLKRHFIGIDIDPEYCCLTEKRLQMADEDASIQGYSDGVFWERNALTDQRKMIRRYHESPLIDLMLPQAKGE